jgi:hypothetical protein
MLKNTGGRILECSQGIKKRCCRTNFPLRSNFAAERGVRFQGGFVGIAKRAWEEAQERGFSVDDNLCVCIDCFEDYGIRDFIEENHTGEPCDFCESSGEFSCRLEDVLAHIMMCIQTAWGHPANEGLPYETREGGWQGEVYDSWELLDSVGLEINSDSLQECIYSSLLVDEWCRRNPYSLSKDRTLYYGWIAFSDFVKSKARYVFYKANNSDYDRYQHDEMNPVDILDSLQNILNEIGLIKTVDVETNIYRVRITRTTETLKNAKELGSPPGEFAIMANRMSPAGIPMFYGAFDVETAIKETYEPDDHVKKATCGVFQPLRPLTVIDLSEKIYIPSLFDEHNLHIRDDMVFLVDFLKDFTRPIERTNRVHVDYVPTQVVTEFIRHIFKDVSGKSIDGVVYPSSRSEDGKAIVVFAESEQCIDDGETILDRSLLVLKRTFTRILTRANMSGEPDTLVHKVQTKDGHCTWPFNYSFNIEKVNCPRCIEILERENKI